MNKKADNEYDKIAKEGEGDPYERIAKVLISLNSEEIKKISEESDKSTKGKIDARAKINVMIQKIFYDENPKVASELFKIGRIEEVSAIRAYLSNETDRGVALLSAAYLDERLTELFRIKMIDDKGLFKEITSGNGPLSTFSGKMKMSYMLKYIDKKMFLVMNKIRDIRNKFAHLTEYMDFDVKEVRNKCLSLYDTLGLDHDGLEPRRMFIRAMLHCAAAINISAHNTEISK